MHLQAKTTTKKFLSFILFLMLSLTVTAPLSANAANNVSPGLTAEYDLLQGGTQEFTVENSDGTTAYVTITEIPTLTRIDSGTYKISYKEPNCWTATYYIKVSSNSITSAYNPTFTVSSGSISSPRLELETSKQSTLYSHIIMEQVQF